MKKEYPTNELEKNPLKALMKLRGQGRNRIGLGRREIAEKLGITPIAVSKITADNNYPKVRTLIRMERVKEGLAVEYLEYLIKNAKRT